MRTRVCGIGRACGDLREEARGVVDPLRAQVPGGQGERQLEVAGRQRARLLQLAAPPRSGCPPAASACASSRRVWTSFGSFRGEPRQDLHGRGGLSQLEVREGEGLEREAVLDRRGRGAPERLPGLRQPALDPRERAHQQPALEQGVAVVALGGLELALAQAGSPPPPSPGRGARPGPARPRRARRGDRSGSAITHGGDQRQSGSWSGSLEHASRFYPSSQAERVVAVETVP